MIKLRAILIISLLCFLFPVKNSFAQAEVVKNGDSYTFVFNEVNDEGDVIRWKTTNHSSRSTISASGNIVKKLNFQLQDDHPLMGHSFVFGAKITIDEETYVVDEMVYLKKDGRFQVNVHLNGAGNRLPIGWIIED